MNHTSLSRDELIKSALSAIQDLDFIFKRSTDNPLEKQNNHLLPVVSRSLDHIREVTKALDNLFMQQFNRNERSGPSTFHPNSGEIGASNKKLSEDKDVKKLWLRDFNEKLDDIVEYAIKAYSVYYKRKLREVQGRDASTLIDSNSFKELLDLFGAAFPDDLNFKCGKALHLYVQGMDTDYRTRLSVLEAICGVKTLDQKTNNGDDNKVNHRPEL